MIKGSQIVTKLSKIAAVPMPGMIGKVIPGAKSLAVPSTVERILQRLGVGKPVSNPNRIMGMQVPGAGEMPKKVMPTIPLLRGVAPNQPTGWFKGKGLPQLP